MSDVPFFSVVIPAFNRENSILRTIQSVFDQAFSDFELLVVDDGSTDETVNVVNSVSDCRIRIIRQENRGASSARNKGIIESKGKFVAFLDSDDIFLSHHLQQAFDYIKDNGDVCTFTQVVVDRGSGIKYIKPHRAPKDGEHISEYLMSDRGFIPTISLVVPQKLAKSVQYDESLSKGDDYDFAIRIAAAGGKLVMLDKPSAEWDDSWNPNRLSNSRNTQERINWLNRIKSIITDKAYHSEMGWPVARYLAEDGNKTKALVLYFSALFRGCYRLKMAIVIFLQIVLSKSNYRKMSDFLAKFGISP